MLEPIPAGGFAVPDQYHALPPWMKDEAPLARTVKKPLFENASITASEIRMDRVLKTPLLSAGRNGEIWARTKGLRTCFSEGQVTAYPVFGSAAPDESPIAIRVTSVTVGGTSLDVAAVAQPRALPGEEEAIEIRRTGFRESWNLSLESIEQTFVFSSLPDRGELTVAMTVDTQMVADEHDGLLRFTRAGLGGVTYGRAFAFDATGRTVPVERTFDGERLSLTVPASFVETAVLPLTIDPPVVSFSLAFGTADDSHPAVCFAKRPGAYFVTWQDYTSQTNSDCYVTSFGLDGTELATITVEIGNDFWARPRIGYVPAGDRLLVAASVTPDGPGSGSGRIEGRMIDAVQGAVASPIFQISSFGSEKVEPVVGGTNFESLTNNHFVVAWSRLNSASSYSIEYRVIDWNTSPITSIEVVTQTANIRARQPAVSASHGDSSLSGDFWTLAWNEDPTMFAGFRGKIKARRVVWSGNPTLGNGNYTVNGDNQCGNPSCGSRMDRALPLNGGRPSLIAYDHQGGIFQASNIFVNVARDGAAYGPSNIGLMEDFDGGLTQFEPSIASDGEAFALAYSEVYYGDPSGTDYDMYMCSGSIAKNGSGYGVALSERHKLLGFTGNQERAADIAMIQDGNPTSPRDDGMVLWHEDTTGPGGQIHGATFDAATLQGSSLTSVGVQYCDANVHSGNSDQVGPDASWIWIEGDRSIQTTHRVHCVEMPRAVFGYLLCSRTIGNVNLAGGGSGRLCLDGEIGRFVTQVGSSDVVGGFTTTVDPTSLPQPTGFVSAALGESWNFQIWHRDAINGSLTSNMSNACTVQFVL